GQDLASVAHSQVDPGEIEWTDVTGLRELFQLFNDREDLLLATEPGIHKGQPAEHPRALSALLLSLLEGHERLLELTELGVDRGRDEVGEIKAVAQLQRLQQLRGRLLVLAIKKVQKPKLSVGPERERIEPQGDLQLADRFIQPPLRYEAHHAVRLMSDWVVRQCLEYAPKLVFRRRPVPLVNSFQNRMRRVCLRKRAVHREGIRHRLLGFRNRRLRSQGPPELEQTIAVGDSNVSAREAGILADRPLELADGQPQAVVCLAIPEVSP